MSRLYSNNGGYNEIKALVKPNGEITLWLTEYSLTHSNHLYDYKPTKFQVISKNEKLHWYKYVNGEISPRESNDVNVGNKFFNLSEKESIQQYNQCIQDMIKEKEAEIENLKSHII